MDSLVLNAKAKINLYLDVTRKRADGYHLLETVMHTVSLCDTVTLTKTGRSGTGISSRGVSIDIIKRIPSQAGMGGGSADGAAVLTGLDRLFETGLSESELISIGAKIGADIPFCIKGGCGYCTGIGEIIQPLPAICGYVLIGKGQAGISTAEAFGKIDSLGSGIGITGIKKIFGNVSSLTDIAPFCRNIFDDVTSLEEVTNIKRIMSEKGAVCSAMTGSGSAVFGLFESESVAAKAQEVLKQKNYFTALCRLS